MLVAYYFDDNVENIIIIFISFSLKSKFYWIDSSLVEIGLTSRIQINKQIIKNFLPFW